MMKIINLCSLLSSHISSCLTTICSTPLCCFISLPFFVAAPSYFSQLRCLHFCPFRIHLAMGLTRQGLCSAAVHTLPPPPPAARMVKMLRRSRPISVPQAS